MPAALTLEWRPQARTALLAIVTYIAEDNPDAAQGPKDEIEAKAKALLTHPKLYKSSRVEGTRELVVRPNYVLVYWEDSRAVTILRMLHAAQQWPPASRRQW